ncbi:MAG: hypothetical protein SGARI_005125 [Bacillariaceae sp.]
MNQGGLPYTIANAPTYDTEELSKSYEYFDVYSLPIKPLYSEVHWTSHGHLPLPDEVIQRFENGKVMALMGYEVDQVLEQPVTDATRHMSHGSDKVWTVEPVEGALTDELLDYPHSQFISEGNGGEMRKSWHGYPKGYAQLVQSPTAFNVVPMQIDTWNREMTNSTFIPGPLPKSSQIRDGVAGYNPLLECPCSDRLKIEWGMGYTMDPKSCDGETMKNATECFQAAQKLIPSNKISTETVSEDSLPEGCAARIGVDGELYATWNKHGKKEDDIIEVVQAEVAEDESKKVVGVANGVVNMTISMDAADNTATITLEGPHDKWFGT